MTGLEVRGESASHVESLVSFFRMFGYSHLALDEFIAARHQLPSLSLFYFNPPFHALSREGPAVVGSMLPSTRTQNTLPTRYTVQSFRLQQA